MIWGTQTRSSGGRVVHAQREESLEAHARGVSHTHRVQLLLVLVQGCVALGLGLARMQAIQPRAWASALLHGGKAWSLRTRVAGLEVLLRTWMKGGGRLAGDVGRCC